MYKDMYEAYHIIILYRKRYLLKNGVYSVYFLARKSEWP